jgi:putative protease
VLKEVPQVRTWKIEGRKKGPHYVYYTVKAYQMLRDEFSDPQSKRAALKLLEMALGRPGTHYNFLPQRPQNPLNAARQTGSGFMVGKTKGPRNKSFLVPREALLPGDTLRIGYEDQQGHTLLRIKKSVPKNGKFYLNLPAKKVPSNGTPVFLTDRREQSLDNMIAELETELETLPSVKTGSAAFALKYPRAARKRGRLLGIDVYRSLKNRRHSKDVGFWLSDSTLRELKKGSSKGAWCWLPPVIWPQDEDAVQARIANARQKGCRQFVLNAPWQTAFFTQIKNLTLWAGPFCNAANPLALKTLADMGFNGVIVSPELGGKDYLALPGKSPLPLGVVVSGHWPLCVSRVVSDDMKAGVAFTSPRGEQGWVAGYDDNYWVFPNWQLDLQSEVKGLERAGYKMIVNLVEPVPRGVKVKKRPGVWNWKIDLK